MFQLEECSHRNLQMNTGKEPTVPLSLRTWHRRLGHLNEGDIRILANNAATKIKLDSSSNSEPLCIPCLQGKRHLVINHNPSERATLLGTFIHSDLCRHQEQYSGAQAPLWCLLESCSFKCTFKRYCLSEDTIVYLAFGG